MALLLAALGLALHHDPGRDVRDADGRVRLVDVLTAGTARAVPVDLQVLVVDVDLAHLDLRDDVHGGEGGLAAVGRVEGREAHEPVDADLVLEVAVGVFTVELHGDAPQSRLFGVVDHGSEQDRQ